MNCRGLRSALGSVHAVAPVGRGAIGVGGRVAAAYILTVTWLVIPEVRTTRGEAATEFAPSGRKFVSRVRKPRGIGRRRLVNVRPRQNDSRGGGPGATFSACRRHQVRQDCLRLRRAGPRRLGYLPSGGAYR